ncbi:hypothetical protein DPMN_002715 [Dreissena polymorpha]|uniref:Uncharacterized protein n=1 Tax=Dreissena polymorpha TaxID=45954 RepID=A0A9D4MMJ2_DREPO|nr:hypothetical protein DPMN_002715 [Dreissena polymorpha]
MPRIIKLHRYIDRDSQMTPIDFQVFSSQFTRRSSDLGLVKTEIQNILKRKREILDKFEGNFNSESKNPERESDYASEHEFSEGKNWLLDWRMRAGWLAGWLAGGLAGWRNKLPKRHKQTPRLRHGHIISPRRPNRVFTRRIAVALGIDPRNDAESV